MNCGVPAEKSTVPDPEPLLPALRTTLPLVVVMAALSMFTLFPAINKRPPSVVVMAEFTYVPFFIMFISPPAFAAKFPPVVVTACRTFTSRNAFNVRVDALVHVTASLTKISPLPGVVPYKLVAVFVPVVTVLMTTLLVTRLAESVVPRISPPAPMMKSCGSISQLPDVPCAAWVVIRASPAILTCAAEVSMKPPSPPLGADASNVPPTFTVPFCMSPISLIVPLWFSMVCARITPLLFTTPCSRLPADRAVIRTSPPSARIIPPFCTRALTAPWFTVTLSSPSPATSSVKALPAASATVPSLAEITPSLLTFAPSSAT